MTVSGTTDFNLDFTDIAEEAWERAGREMNSGYDLRTARRSMNLLTIEWQNRGINMWTLEEGSVALSTGTATYDLPADTVDLLEHFIRTGTGTSQSDVSATRISVSSYASINNKNTTGAPRQIMIARERDNPTFTLWPIPESDSYTLGYWRLRRIQDAGSGVETPDIVYRFLPALTAGLAYYIRMKNPSLPTDPTFLKAEYEEQFMLAAEEDRERASWRLVPRIQAI